MIDDELLQELLGQATGHYNNGDYQRAIEAWKEALRVDPGSQKAREGIQMATLLLAGYEPAVETDPVPEPVPPADGGGPGFGELSKEDLEARLDRGISRVRDLLNDRKYSEAIEGARSLVPMDPDSEEVQRLVEEAQQAFEAAPFIEEHLTLARELASQGRFDEAEVQCRKVFALDRTNPDAHNLIAELRRRAREQKPAAPAAPEPPEIGGSTVRMDLSEVLGELSAPERGQPEPPAASGQAGSGTDARPAKDEPFAEPLPTEMLDFELDLGGGESMAEASGPPAPQEDATPGTPAPAVEVGGPEPEAEFVDADTVVPPSVRLVPRTGPSPDAASWLEKLDGSELIPTAQGEPAPEAAPPLAKGDASGAGSSGWEQELESLNRTSGEHDILGRSAARAPVVSTEAIDSDLSSLLGEDPGLQPAIATVPDRKPEEAPPARPRSEESPRPVVRPRPIRREDDDEAPPSEIGSRRSVSVYFGLLGVVLLAAGGAAWWFFFQPQMAAGRGPSAATPPSAPSGETSGVAQEPIPTPIGSTSREPVKPPPAGEEGAAVQGGAAKPDATSPRPGPEPPSQATAPSPAPEPPPRPRTPEELRAEVGRRMSEGRRLLAAEKWSEARDEFAAVIALDPVNFQGKELLDQAQQHVDQDVKVRRDLEEARSAFEEKNYQGALWKLYRLPRDPRLGDIDRYIRNAWFNWAVLGLKGGDATNALQKLNEALSADPDDADAAKIQEVAQRYASKPKDKVFYSYVDSLKYRAFDQK